MTSAKLRLNMVSFEGKELWLWRLYLKDAAQTRADDVWVDEAHAELEFTGLKVTRVDSWLRYPGASRNFLLLQPILSRKPLL